jgi:hypothetical protein
MGIIQQLDTNFTDPYAEGLPYIPLVDGMESAGSLVLVRPGGFGVGSTPPANQQILTNEFRTQAAALMGGSATAADADLKVWTTGTSSGVTHAITPKGGLNTKIPVAEAFVGTDISLKAPMIAYMKATGHDFFFSAWYRRTHAAINTPGTTSPFVSGGGTAFMALNAGVAALANGQLVDMGSFAWMTGNPQPTILGSGLIAQNAIGPTRSRAAVRNTNAAWTGAAYNEENALLWHVSPRGVNGGSRKGAQGGYVLYRLYVEDLTVSARTYAQVDAIDGELYARAFGTGGPLATDTWAA